MAVKNSETVPMNERVHAELKRRIIHCEMMPGAPISEEEAAAEFGCSRTPIREALLQLKRERLVDIWPRKGIFVTEILLKDVHEIYQMRLIIEPAAARIVAPKLAPEKLRAYKLGFEAYQPYKGSLDDRLRLDREFHDYLIESTGNEYLIQTYRELLDLNHRIRMLTSRNSARVAEGVDEHLAIIDALKARDESAIAETMAKHILNSQNAALYLDNFVKP